MKNNNSLTQAAAALAIYLATALAGCFGRTRYFASGSNRAPEIRGMAQSGCDFGVAAPEMMSESGSPLPAMAELERAAAYGVRCFVDSGAFSEVTFTANGPTWPKPLTGRDWARVFRCYAIAADAFGSRCYVVAPDQVASQEGTLRRQEAYRTHVQRIAAKGAQILVPVQKGALSMADFYAAELVTLGVPAAQVIPSIPMKKDATSVADLVDFCRTVQPRRLHLLGLGPKRRGRQSGFAAVIAAVEAAAPGCVVQCDSVPWGAIAGTTGGRQVTDGVRPLTFVLAQLESSRPELSAQARRTMAIRMLADAARPAIAQLELAA